jgi:putative transposase
LYSYKFRLYPTEGQEIFLAKHFGCCRFVYNHFLEKRTIKYQETKKSSTYLENQNQLPELKSKYEFLKEIGSQSLQYAVRCLDTAYTNFFRKVKQKIKGKKGFPHKKKRCHKQSFRIPQGLEITNDKLIIPKFLDGIPITLHRKLEGEIKFGTISKNKSGQYHVSITVDRNIQLLPPTDKIIALDLNVIDIVDNHNNKFLNPRPEKELQSRLRKLSKDVSRKEKGSNNRRKARRKLSVCKQHAHNVREDFLHKVSRQIINENQVICVEDLSIESMLKKNANGDEPRWKEKKRHRDIQDCGFYSFVSKLTYKALWYGRELIKIDRWFPSSQICHHCHYQNHDLKPHDRVWTCWNCWETNDRNHNSAENILEEGMRKRTCGMQGLAYCPDVRPKVIPGLLVG